MSTSTGYHEKTITREPPTSSGQVMSWADGCKEDFDSGAEVVFNIGSAFSNENIAEPQKLSTALPADGLSYFTTGGDYYLKARKGAQKTLVSFTTEIVSILAGTSLAAGRFGTSKECCLGISNVKLVKGMGAAVQLVGIGASTWVVMTHSSGMLATVQSASSSVAS